MHKYFLKIAWGCLIGCLALSILVVLEFVNTGRVEVFFLLAFLVAGCGALAFLGLRFRFFRKRLETFIGHLLAGKYDASMRVSRRIDDELTRLERLLNKLAGQLRSYDELFAERVSMSHRAFELLFRMTDQGVIMADAEKKIFRFNPPALGLFGLEQRVFSFDAIEKLPANDDFSKQFRQVLEENKLPMETTVTLQIPVRNEQRRFRAKLVPLKDYEERVLLVMIFVIAKPDESGDATDPGL